MKERLLVEMQTAQHVDVPIIIGHLTNLHVVSASSYPLPFAGGAGNPPPISKHIDATVSIWKNGDVILFALVEFDRGDICRPHTCSS